jgi:hypothetical protein
MSKPSFRFTVTLNRPQGSRVFKGTMDGSPNLDMALFALRELLNQNAAFQPDVTSLKVTISPASNRKPSSPSNPKSHQITP